MGLSQMSGTVRALDEVTCSGNCEVSEKEARRQQMRVNDSTAEEEKDEGEVCVI